MSTSPDVPVTVSRSVEIGPMQSGMRLDQAAAEVLGEFSRSRLKQWIEQGALLVNGGRRRPRDRVHSGDRIELRATLEQHSQALPEAIPLDIRFEDESLLVLNKPAGLVVHPAAGNWQGTLQNALLHHAPELGMLPRAGIVHRLDKDTSGLMVVAKTLAAHQALVRALQQRLIGREYLAVVVGTPTGGGTVDAPIGRHPTQRTKMAVVPQGKPARTHFSVRERYRAHCLIHCRLESGRTHQIRVHMASIGYPLLGDPVYGGRLRLPPGADGELQETLRGFRRQALHAWRLSLQHPQAERELRWEVAPPDDFEQLLRALRRDREAHGA
jgi:23S rRNA pseudouridine1911/1915/1917 synthase